MIMPSSLQVITQPTPSSPTPIHPLLDNIYSFHRSPATRVKSHSVGRKSPHQLLYGWRKDVPLPSPGAGLVLSNELCRALFQANCPGLGYSRSSSSSNWPSSLSPQTCTSSLLLFDFRERAGVMNREKHERVREDGYRTLNDDYLWQA